ncbi:MAG: UDP-2,3-diacylglucosamine diphosphatase LpxI [Pseudomonadota bacterium]
MAVIAGRGALPAALVAGLSDRPLVACLDGFAPDGLTPDVSFRIERLMPFLDLLADRGISDVTFAGAVMRPRLDPALIDPATAQLLPRLMAAMARGDDATLREVITIFEEFDLNVIGLADIAPGLLPGPGVHAGRPTAADEADATRAATIVAALGAVDVGQGAVVQQGLCLGVETLAGTDALLVAVAALPAALRPDPGQGRGLFYKAPKPGQDLRIDLPTIGIATVDRVADAGLGGIAWAADGVICLDLTGMQVRAAARGLFLWAR